MSVLQHSRAWRGLRDDLIHLRDRHLTRPHAAIRHYLTQTKEPRLHLGSSQSHLPGWLETDIDLQRSGTVYLDATRPFPLPDASFDFVYAEHMIEHVDRAGATVLLSECRRVLKPGGVLRLTTPDLAFVLSLHPAPTKDGKRYMRWIGERFLGDVAQADGPTVVNNAFRAWGHQFLYDESKLSTALRHAGFATIERVDYGESHHAALRDIESHGANVGNEEMARLETMIVEAS